MLSHNTSSPYNKVISSGYHHRSQPHGMQPQLAPDAASEVVKPTDTLSPRRRVLGELSANSRRRTSPSSTKHIFNSLDSPVPSTSPVKVSLKSPILRSVTLPNQPAAHAVSAIDEAENQSSNVIKISNNNSKKRSIDQINSSASEQLRRSPVRHAPSVSVSLFQRGNELSNGKDADEPSGLIDAKTRTSHSSATDHDASTTTATTNYTPPVEALVKDETDSLDEKLGGRIATKKVRKIILVNVLSTSKTGLIVYLRA